MAGRKPIEPDDFAQRSLEAPESGQDRATLRMFTPHRDAIIEIAVAHGRWQWLRGVGGKTIAFLAIVIPLGYLLADRIGALFSHWGASGGGIP